MGTKTQTLKDRVERRLLEFNNRLEGRVGRRRNLIVRLHEEEDFKKSVGHMKAFFACK